MINGYLTIYDLLGSHSIKLIQQQFGYTSGKNATDSALIIEVMDLLHQSHLDGFCLIPSDSDFTRLATTVFHQQMQSHALSRFRPNTWQNT